MIDREVRINQALEANKEVPLPNNDGIRAYYDALILLGQSEQRLLPLIEELRPPYRTETVPTANGDDFVVKESPDVLQLINGLEEKKAKVSFSEREKIDTTLAALVENSSHSYWELGNRKDIPGFRAQRIIKKAQAIAQVRNKNVQVAIASEIAAEELGTKRELIVSKDPSFYNVQVLKNGQLEGNASSMEVEIFRNTGLITMPSREAIISRNPITDEETADVHYNKSSQPEEAPLLIATEVKNKMPQKRIRPWKRNKNKDYKSVVVPRSNLAVNQGRRNFLMWSGAAAVSLALAGVETQTHMARNILGIGSIDKSFPDNSVAAGSIKQEPGATTTPTTNVEPVSATVAKVEPAPTATTVSTAPEAPKRVDPIGVEWLPDTMTPWKDLIAKEAALYGIDAAIPAIYAFIKTAGDYTFLTNDGEKAYGGLFGLSEDAFKEGAKALKIDNPIMVNSGESIRVGVRHIALKFKEAGGSIRKTGILLEGADGEVPKALEAMMNERNLKVSPAFQEWEKKYGYRIEPTRAKLKGL